MLRLRPVVGAWWLGRRWPGGGGGGARAGGAVSNAELFLEWLVGSEEGGRFLVECPELVERWLRAFNDWCRALVALP